MAILGVASNTGSLNIVRNLSTIQRSLRKTQDKLSSGFRINSADDDPAGLVISEQMRSQVATVSQQISNLENTINRNKTADSAMMQLEDQLLEMREIAVSATSTGNVDDAMRNAYEDALNSSVNTYNDIVENESYGTQKLFDGSEGSVADLETITQFDLSDSEQAEQAIAAIDEKLNEVTKAHGDLGANSANDIEVMQRNLRNTQVNLTQSESQIRDADMAAEKTREVSLMLRLQGGISLMAQGNLLSSSVLGLLNT